MSYAPKTYRATGGDQFIVANGGAITVEAGGAITTAAQELTVSGAITAGVPGVELNHATVAVAATIADAANHPGLFSVKDTSASGTAAHTVTLASGTWDGTNTIVTLNAPAECIVVYFDTAGNGTIVVNVGAVALS